MSINIHKQASTKEIHDAIQKLISRKKKKELNLDNFFGKVKFDVDGLTYQKKIRNEWE